MKIQYLFLITAIILLTALPAPAGTISFNYDQAGRLIKADYGRKKSIIFSYDQSGNLLKRKVESSENTKPASSKSSLFPSLYWPDPLIFSQSFYASSPYAGNYYPDTGYYASAPYSGLPYTGYYPTESDYYSLYANYLSYPSNSPLSAPQILNYHWDQA